MDDENRRIFACDIIQNAGILLKLPQVAIATAQVLLQRVYNAPLYTFDRHPFDITAMAALFLAAKVEEHPRKAREVMDVFVQVISIKLQKNIRLNYAKHERLREELITTERRLIKNLGFNLLSDCPHKILISYYNAMIHALDREEKFWTHNENEKMLQRAWNYCNDSLRTEISIKYSKEAVICACIQVAREDFELPYPKSSDGREWYGLFVNDESEVKAIIEVIKKLYRKESIDPHKLKASMYLMELID